MSQHSSSSISSERTVSEPAKVPISTLLLFALTSGLAVADLYFAQPLMASIAKDFELTPAFSGIVISVSQLGYVLGLLTLVPLADVIDRRKLILFNVTLTSLALISIGFATQMSTMIVAVFALGILGVVIQMLVALAAVMSAPADQGRAVGAVTSGVVFGIIAARSLAGPMAELSNWRMVYFGAAALMMIATLALVLVLPKRAPVGAKVSYAQLLKSAPLLLIEEPLLRIRAGIALLLFAGFGVLWSSLALGLSAAPTSLTLSQIGWFGVAGFAGIVGASCAGRLFDRGWGQWTTGISLTLMCFAWWPISQLGSTLWLVFVGVAIFDLGGQATHVTSQSMLFRARPDARNRLVAAYMLFYSVGMGVGALASTTAFAWSGWRGVCILGATISGAAWLLWICTLDKHSKSSATFSHSIQDGVVK